MKQVCFNIVALVFLLFGPFLSAEATKVETVTVNALTTTTLTFQLRDENKFSGALSVVGGSNNDVDFWVTDPAVPKFLTWGKSRRKELSSLRPKRTGRTCCISVTLFP